MGFVYTVVNQAYEGNVMGPALIIAMVVLVGAGLIVKTNRGYVLHLIAWAMGLALMGTVTRAIS